MSLPGPDSSPTVQSRRAANSNASGPAVKISFDELVVKSGLDEETLLRRIADVLQRGSDGAASEIISAQATE